jgi:hypothetical protein
MADYPPDRDVDVPGGDAVGDPTGAAGAAGVSSAAAGFPSSGGDGGSGGKGGGQKETIVVKVALVGDSGVGKTSLMASADACAGSGAAAVGHGALRLMTTCRDATPILHPAGALR